MSLKEYRLSKKVTQEQLARATEINLRTIQYIEQRNNTDIKRAKRISDFFNDTIENVFLYQKD